MPSRNITSPDSHALGLAAVESIYWRPPLGKYTHMSDLTQAQQEALAELRQITNGEDPERELATLESVGWNVEVCAF